MRVYVASNFGNRGVVKDLSRILTERGHVTVQTWPDEHEACAPADAAIRDLLELESADAIVLYTVGCDKVPGGMHFEAGYAKAKGKRFTVVGPAVNVFCHIADERFDNVDELVASGFWG